MTAVTTLHKLPEKWKQRAKDELGEDDKEVGGAIETLRSWAVQEPWLDTPTDSEFLLRYMRVRKFSQLEARTTLGNFWTNRTKNSNWFTSDSHPGNPKILELIKSGFYLVSPAEDSQGRRLIIERHGILNMSEIEKTHGSLDIVVQAWMCIHDMFHMDERVQVNGYHDLIDASTASLDTAKLQNPFLYKKLQPILEKSYPSRTKGLHIYGMPRIFEPLAQFGKSMMKPKLRDRFFFYDKMLQVYGHIEKQLLPKEYLPDDYEGPCAGTIKDFTDYTVKECTRPEVIAHIKELNSGKYRVDLKLKESTETPSESFRKLNVD